MKPLTWQLTKFNGMAYDDANDISAREMTNLRVNRADHLEIRHVIQSLIVATANDLLPGSDYVTGVAAAGNFIYILANTGNLYIFDRIPVKLTQISNISGMTGRLSIVPNLGDGSLDILTSEGDDYGYVVTRATFPTGVVASALPLGFDKPELDVTGTEGSKMYTPYALTYLWPTSLGTVETEPVYIWRQLPDSRVGANWATFTIKSGVTVPSSVRLLRLYKGNEEVTNTGIAPSGGYHRVNDTLITSQNRAVVDNQVARVNPSTDDPLDATENLPRGAKRVVLFNDRLFCANGSEVRYSEVDGALLKWWSWKPADNLRTGEMVEFVDTFRGMLLFGAANNFYRLTGTSPTNYSFGRLGSKGPVSAFAGAVIEGGFGFISSDGIYITDGGSTPQSIDAVHGFFLNAAAQEGYVANLPNSRSSFFDVIQRVPDESQPVHTIFMTEFGRWQIMDVGNDIAQLTSFKFPNIPEFVAIADGRRMVRLMQHLETELTEDEVYLVSGGTASTERINWSYESQTLDWDAQGAGKLWKMLRVLEISAYCANPVTITMIVDEKTPIVIADKVIQVSRDKKVMLQIGRGGYSFRFKLEGTGGVKIWSLGVEAWA